MQALNERLTDIISQVERLVQQVDALKVERSRIVEENIQLKKELEETTKVAEVKGSSELPKLEMIREELDTYIGEIDQCINILKSA